MITKTRWKNLDALSLENDALRVILLPALGGKAPVGIRDPKYRRSAFSLGDPRYDFTRVPPKT